jgi:hypothetical protein
MRRIIILAAAIVGLLAPCAYAQSGTSVSPGGGVLPAHINGQTDPGNCGTPETFKKCPPMPRHPLQHYPAYR